MQYAYRSWLLLTASGLFLWCSIALGQLQPTLSTFCAVFGLIAAIIAVQIIEKHKFVAKSRFLKIAVYFLPIFIPLLYHIFSIESIIYPEFISPIELGNIKLSGNEILLWSILGFSLSINLSKFIYSDHKPSPYISVIKTFLTYVVIILIIEFVFTFCYKALLVFELQPDFSRLTDYNLIQYQIVISLFMIVTSTFIITHHLTSIVQYYVPDVIKRMSIWAITILAFGFFHLYVDVSIQYLHFILGTSSFVILLDLYTESKQRSFSWILIWLIILSGLFTTVFISKQQEIFKNQIVHFELDSKNEILKIPNNIHLATNKNGISSLNGLFKDIGLFQFYENENQWTYEQYIIKKKTSNFQEIYFALPKSSIESSVNLFTIFFTIGFILLLIIGITNGLFHYLPQNFYLSFDVRKSMKNRLQITLIGTIIFAFIVIGFSTVYFIDLQQTKSNNNRFVRESHQLLKIHALSSKDTTDFITAINSNFQSYHITLDAADKQDYSSTKENSKNINGGNFKQYIYDSIYPSRLSSLIGKVDINNESFAYTMSNMSNLDDYSSSSSSILNTLIKVYVFLFLIAYAIAVLITNSITWPLITLSEKLKTTTLGATDQEVEWPNEDEIGQLIQNYNMMLRKLNRSANLLARNEREMAWREMAKQVAHEIKNPLTPMKLSIQYLQHASNSGTHDLNDMIKKVSHTLIEQIDNLTRIATEFSNFAKMPNAQNDKVILNEVVVSVHNLFRKREDMDIQCYLPIDEIYVFADKDHLIRIMNNLIKNAIQAIPTERPGSIIIRLQKSDRRAIISIEDNGIGIPESMKDKIFEPNFTTKSSGTGLGLAMCANMINGFNGDIYFKPNENIGTTFFVEIPMMRLEDNFKKEERVILE